tara:strand:+ start:4005 stop:4805 length:801 start_codon:yes stop_codon:yes gene_type:complete
MQDGDGKTMIKKHHNRDSGNGGMLGRVGSMVKRFSKATVDRKTSGNPDLVFIWVPKAAGTSIFTFLSDRLGMKKLKTAKQAMSFVNRGAVTFGHQHYLSLLEAGFVSQDFNSRAFKFAFARNPYARVASLYNYLNQRDLTNEHCFDRFLDDIRLRPPIGLYNLPNLSLANPITDWLMNDTGTFLVDRVFKVEEMYDFSRYFEQHYGLRFDAKERHNTSNQVISIEDITGNAERIEKINRIYERDFELLGYEMINPQWAHSCPPRSS